MVILISAKIAVYLINPWRSLEMPLINCKIKSKLKWTNHCVLSVLATENSNVNSDSTIFVFKDTKLYASIVVLSVKNNQKLSKILAKDLRD